MKFIEVFYNHEILKRVNIIDTPGLDALSQIDSKNTIAFLKEVHPDAVVMLFIKSIAESTMSILQDFQGVGTGDFNLSAMNAIGVLSKADTIWSVMDPEKIYCRLVIGLSERPYMINILRCESHYLPFCQFHLL